MSQTWEKQEGNEGILTITIPSEELDTALDAAFKKVSKDVSLPGFRKGKVPRQMFEKRFGVESLYQDALDILLPENYAKAIEEADINPVAQPSVDVEQIEKGKDVILKATVTVEPEVKLGEYKGLEGEEIDRDVTDEEIDHQIDHITTEYSDLVVKEEGTVENGDIATIDFHGFVDGEAFKREDIRFTLEGDTFTLDEMETVITYRWKFGQFATVTVLKDGGLSKGQHHIKSTQTIAPSYMPVILVNSGELDFEL